jgi:flagellar motor switch protein FliN/FliY
MPNLTEEKALDIVLDVKLKVTVQLGSVQLPMREVLGALARLDCAAHPARHRPRGVVRQRQAGRVREVVVVEDNFGIKITELVGSSKS